MLYFYLNENARTNGVAPLCAPKTGDAGYDIRSNEFLDLKPGEQALIATGLHVKIPVGMVGILKDRSSMARAGIRVSGGVIDAAYRGEIRVLLENRSDSTYAIHINDRIVQMIVVACSTQPTLQVDDLAALGETERGGAGFGSTGV